REEYERLKIYMKINNFNEKKVNENSDFIKVEKREIIICENCKGLGCSSCNNTGRKVKIEISYMTLDLNSGVPRSIIYEDFYSEIAICKECKGKGYKTYGFFKDTSQESKKLCTDCNGLGRYKVYNVTKLVNLD
nr:hypothetical protein [Bacteroidales bacterium]